MSTPLSFNFARWFTTADNSVFPFVSGLSRVLSCALGCSCVELLDRCTLIRHLLGRWRRLHDLLLLRYLDSLLLQLVGRHALGRLLQHLVVCCLVWSSPLRYHVCRKTCHGVSLRPLGRCSGHPRPSRVRAPVCRGCPCRDPLE